MTIDLKLYKRPVAAVQIAGDRVRTTPGVLSKFSSALAAVDVNIYGISSGEFSFTFYIDEAELEKVKKALHDVVEKHSAFASLTAEKNLGMITVSGQEFIDTPGMFVKLVKPISDEKIDVVSISTSFDSVVMFIDWPNVRRAYDLIEKTFLKGF